MTSEKGLKPGEQVLLREPVSQGCCGPPALWVAGEGGPQPLGWAVCSGGAGG